MMFHAGELVSCGYAVGAVITGRIVQLRRKVDGAPFLMVEITSGPKQGQRTWVEPHWQLGVGPHQGTCERCQREFRYQDGDVAHTCQRCWNRDQGDAERRADDPDRPRTSWERKQIRDRRGEKDLVTS